MSFQFKARLHNSITAETKVNIRRRARTSRYNFRRAICTCNRDTRVETSSVIMGEMTHSRYEGIRVYDTEQPDINNVLFATGGHPSLAGLFKGVARGEPTFITPSTIFEHPSLVVGFRFTPQTPPQALLSFCLIYFRARTWRSDFSKLSAPVAERLSLLSRPFALNRSKSR